MLGPARTIEAMRELARQTATTDSPGIAMTSVRVNVRGGSDNDAAIAVFDKGQPIDSGPKPREPIAWGNSKGYGESVTLPILGTCGLH
jgi:hypothetical protein